MNIVTVAFKNKHDSSLSKTDYIYLTDLNLIEGATYNIIADHRTSYENPVLIKSIKKTTASDIANCLSNKGICHLRTITSAELLEGAPRPKSKIKNVYFNHTKKTTTVIWIDGSVTIVRCCDEDEFDEEKGLAMCFVKRSFDNRGCYNKIMREIINNPDNHIKRIKTE